MEDYFPDKDIVELLIRTSKEQGVYHHHFKNMRHAERILADWIRFYIE